MRSLLTLKFLYKTVSGLVTGFYYHLRNQTDTEILNSEKVYKKGNLLPILALSLLGLVNCGDESGEFGFATTYDQGKTVLELDLAKATDYKMMREKIIFSPRDTIHYVYKFAQNPLAPYGANDEFSVSLEKESLGFVEIDLKKKYMNSDNNALQDKFKNLDIGHYIMKISFDGEIIDSVYFDVVPDEGYALDESEENSIENQKDEIVRYSK